MAVLIRDKDFSGVAGAVTAGIIRGNTLRTWWNTFPEVELRDLPGTRPESRLQYFFSELPIDEVPTTISGCVQVSTYRRKAGSDQPPVSLADWAANNFLSKARWVNPNGRRGGILYRPVLICDKKTGIERVDENFDLKIADVGTRFEWACMRIDLLDYMKALPHPISKAYQLFEPMNREAGYVVIHPDFFETPYPAPEGCVEDFCFAYSVSPWTVLPTIAAYGPGRFYTAFKQFRFFLMEDGSVAVEVLFLVAPRCYKVFNILGFDPIFHTVDAYDWLTRKRTKVQDSAHFGVNKYAMGHHARVHENLLDGMREIWENTNWQPARRQAETRLSSGR